MRNSNKTKILTGLLAVELENPIGTNTFESLVGNIATAIFNIAIPIAVIVIIYAGIMIMASRGNPEKRKSALDTLKYAIIGLAVVLIGRGFISLIQSVLELGQ